LKALRIFFCCKYGMEPPLHSATVEEYAVAVLREIM
jgi:hypothetical protein